MVLPGLEREPELAELREPLAKRRQPIKTWRRRGVAAADVGARIVSAGVADALEAPVARPDVALQHLAHRRAAREVGARNDALAGQHRPIAPARGHRRLAADELGLADELHRLRPARPIERAALDKDGALDLVPALQVRQQLRQQVAAVGEIPQVMVRIADREVRLEDGFGHQLSLRPTKPALPRGRGDPGFLATENTESTDERVRWLRPCFPCFPWPLP